MLRVSQQPGREVAPVKILHSILSALESIVTLPVRLVRSILPGGRKSGP